MAAELRSGCDTMRPLKVPTTNRKGIKPKKKLSTLVFLEPSQAAM